MNDDFYVSVSVSVLRDMTNRITELELKNSRLRADAAQYQRLRKSASKYSFTSSLSNLLMSSVVEAGPQQESKA